MSWKILDPPHKSKKRPAVAGLFPILVYTPSLSVHNTRARRLSAELVNILASGGEQRWNPTSALSRYLPRAHVRLAYHRSRTHAPRHLYMSPLYFEGARLLCVVLFHKRLTGLQKHVNTLCSFI